MLRKNYGCVRVDFAQPFSLKVSLIFLSFFEDLMVLLFQQ